jgi:hypothetical protein
MTTCARSRDCVWTLQPETPLSAEMTAYFAKCQDKLGMVPNVLEGLRIQQ